MAQQNNSLNTSNFIKPPLVLSEDSQYTFQQLSELKKDVDDRFLKASKLISNLSAGGGSSSDLTARVVALEQGYVQLQQQIAQLQQTISLINPADITQLKADVLAIQQSLVVIQSSLTTINLALTRLNNAVFGFPYAQEALPEIDIPEYTVWEFAFDVDLSLPPIEIKYISTIECATTLNPLIAVEGPILDIAANKVYVRIRNSNPDPIPTPAGRVLLYRLYA